MNVRTVLAAATALAIACSAEKTAVAPAATTPPPIAHVASPTGAGAAEPFLFSTSDGIGLSWLEPVAGTDRVALRFAVYRRNGWSAPKTIVERNDLFVNWADFPSVVSSGQNTFFAHWLQ